MQCPLQTKHRAPKKVSNMARLDVQGRNLYVQSTFSKNIFRSQQEKVYVQFFSNFGSTYANTFSSNWEPLEDVWRLRLLKPILLFSFSRHFRCLSKMFAEFHGKRWVRSCTAYIYMSRFYFTPQNWGHTVDISAIWRLDQLDQLMLSCFRNASEIPVINQKFPQTSGPLRWISFTITSSPGKNPLRIFLSYWRPLMESMKHEKGEVGTGNFYW